MHSEIFIDTGGTFGEAGLIRVRRREFPLSNQSLQETDDQVGGIELLPAVRACSTGRQYVWSTGRSIWLRRRIPFLSGFRLDSPTLSKLVLKAGRILWDLE